MAEKTDLKSLTLPELENRLNDAREELMNLRFQLSTGELTDYTRISFTRRTIARLLTQIHEQERKASMEGEA
jgi:large subunit ribosomal protein L29